MTVAPVHLVPGMMISDRIQLESPIGEGGMGSVWAGRHVGLNKPVAVKFVAHATGPAQAVLRQRFMREASAVSRIDNPHVVRTFDFGQLPDGTPFLVMELLQGESIDDRLEREGAMTPEVAARVVVHIASALADAHRIGIIHRDIKPGNILLGRSVGELCAKLIDFGIAKDLEAASSATKSGMMMGTPQYMSPERLVSAKDVDVHADIWGLAVTAYEMLTGTAPFIGGNVPQIIMSIRCRHYVSPSTIVSKATPGVAPLAAHTTGIDAVFARAFAFEKHERFGSIQAFAEAFAAACMPSAHAALGSSATNGAPSVRPASRPIPEPKRTEPAQPYVDAFGRPLAPPTVDSVVRSPTANWAEPGGTVRAGDCNEIALIARQASGPLDMARGSSVPPFTASTPPPPVRSMRPRSSHRTVGLVAIAVSAIALTVAGFVVAAPHLSGKAGKSQNAISQDDDEDETPKKKAAAPAATTNAPSTPAPPPTATAPAPPPVATTSTPAPTQTTSAPAPSPSPSQRSTNTPRGGQKKTPPKTEKKKGGLIDPSVPAELYEAARQQIGVLPPIKLPTQKK